jgi:diacylglycerol kinase (ATP)
LLERVLGVLRAAGHGVTPAPTSGPGDAERVVREAVTRSADLILVLGGDGTLNDALPGVIHTETPLAILPAGTSNVLAHDLRIGTNPARVASRLHLLEPRRVAAGLLKAAPDGKGRYFLLMAGVGFDAHIVHGIDLKLKANVGELAYWWGAVKELGRKLDEFQVEVDGRELTCSFALASRVRNYAGHLEIAEHASLRSEEFEVVLFEGRSALRYYGKYLGAILARRASKIRGISFRRATKIVFAAPEGMRVHVQVDGEYAGLLPASAEIVPQAVTLLVPPTY